MTTVHTCHFMGTCLYVCSCTCLWAHVTCNQTFPPQFTNRCRAAAKLSGQLLSPWKRSWRLSSIPVCIFCGCVRSCMGFFSSGIYNWFMVKSAWLCIVSAVCLYYRSCFDDLRNKVEMGNSPAFRILYTHLPFSKTDLFGCFYVG